MGKPTGFLEYNRQLPGKLDAAERIHHFREFVHAYSPEELGQQSARCMNCGVPFCHSGCPLGNLIPDFNDAVYRADWAEAYELLTSTNNFPEFTGRICPAPCEAACVLGIHQPPVAIEEIEKHIIEKAFDLGLVKGSQPVVRTGKKVAVVGSGPAGLAAADQLNKAGHSVVVFERDRQPGGLLRYGIPDFKLEKWVVDRRIQCMEQAGIVFKCGVEIGSDLSSADLLRDQHAVILATGATIPRNLDVPGREAEGIHFAMSFLKQQNLRISGLTEADLAQYRNGEGIDWDNPISAKGKQVVVIGGGDTGSDCVGTSVRQGAASVTQLELMPMPPGSRTENMPWPSFPMLLKTTSSHEEGCEREWAVLTKSFIKDSHGRVKALELVDLAWTSGADGKPARFTEVAGSLRQIPCDLVLLAMGFVHTQHNGLAEQLGLGLDDRGNLAATEGKYSTRIKKVFACGDARRGQSLVVWAISEGRECARRVDEFLVERSSLEEKDKAALTNFA
jgi:glutamate synthase (NADPH/NADH) small chain